MTPAAGEHMFDEGQQVTLSARPAPGWRFAGWRIDGAVVGEADTSVVMSTDRSATALFVRVRTLTVAVDGQGRVVPGAGSYAFDDGDVVPLSATPADGWRFDRWIVDGADGDTSRLGWRRRSC